MGTRWLNWTRSLRVRYGLTAALLAVAIILVQAIVVGTVRTNHEKQITTTRARSNAAVAVTPIVSTYLENVNEVGFQLTKAMRTLADNLPAFEQFQIVSIKGDVLYDSQSLKRIGALPTLSESDIVKAIQANQASEQTNGSGTYLYYPYFDSGGTHTHTVRFAVSNRSVEEIRQSTLLQTVLALILFVPLSFVVFFWLTNRLIVAAVEQIRSDVNLITSGETDRRVHLKRRDEFGQLADSLNTMAHSILDNIKNLEEEKAWKNEFIILASHNLRTPLSVIMSSIANLKKAGKMDGESQKFVDYIYTRGKELHGMIENLLSISTLKGGRLDAADEPYDLLAVINEIAKDQETRLKAQGLTLTIETRSNHIIARGDRDQIFQVVDNLVDNAIKFTTQGGITIRLDDSKEKITLSVIDTGAGIEEKMVHKLFESFRRGANPMSVDHKGAGLGLYFVKLAVESQGGEIAIKSKPGKGTEITLTLKKGA